MQGAPGALKNTKWVLTGELDNLAREAAIGCIRQYGGEVVTAVSGKVDHLLVGSRLEDGRPVETGSK
jgi:replication factor C subunit 1